MTNDDLPGWQFDVRERSAGVYEGTGPHVSGVSVGPVGDDAGELRVRLRQDAREI